MNTLVCWDFTPSGDWAGNPTRKRGRCQLVRASLTLRVTMRTALMLRVAMRTLLALRVAAKEDIARQFAIVAYQAEIAMASRNHKQLDNPNLKAN